jgi:hypothetical protein
MSQANAAAIRRRAPTAQTLSSQPKVGSGPVGQAPPPTAPSSGLTLQQAISLIDARLLKLEAFAKNAPQSQSAPAMTGGSFPAGLIDEFNSRFEILAGEIDSLKDIVLRLQSYTMSVNKTLLEERISILSDIGDTDPMEGQMILSDSPENNDDQNIILEQTE